MITTAAVWLCLVIHVVYATVIITVSNNGSNDTKWKCICGSLSYALLHIEQNTVVNIVSDMMLYESVALGSKMSVVSTVSNIKPKDNIILEPKKLSGITITGNDVTIMCNNTGSIYCESCSKVKIKGIIWYQCGTGVLNDDTIVPGLYFNTASNIIIENCTFQNSPSCPVYILHGSDDIAIKQSYFIANAVDSLDYYNSDIGCAGLFIYYNRNSYVSVYDSKFEDNGCRLSHTSNLCNLYSIRIISFESDYFYNAKANIAVERVTFSNNSRALYLNSSMHTVTVQLLNVIVCNNTIGGILIGSDKHFTFEKINILSTVFVSNINPITMVLPPKNFITTKLFPTFEINLQDLVFSNNKAISNNDTGTATNFGVLSMHYHYNYSVKISNCSFHSNINGVIDMQVIPQIQFAIIKPIKCPLTYVTFSNVTVYNTTIDSINASDAIVSIIIVETSISVMLINVNFTSNHHSRHNGEVLHITNPVEKCTFNNAYIQLLSCTFGDNTAFDIVALKISRNVNDNDNGVLTSLISCNFNNNFGGNSILNIQGPTDGDLYSHVILDDSAFSNNKGTAFFAVLLILYLMKIFYLLTIQALVELPCILRKYIKFLYNMILQILSLLIILLCREVELCILTWVLITAMCFQIHLMFFY